jgi:NADH-quinone oxidoreductase subunit M
MSFAMAGTFLASDGLLLYYILGTSINPYLFYCLIWGNGDAEERKSSDQILYLYIGRFFIHAYCFCIPISKAGSFLIQDLRLDLTRTEQFWIFWAFSWLMH